jgi:hypothetical protein
MNHISRQSIVTCMRNGHWRGLPEGLTADIVDKVLNDQPCTACALGKRNKLNRQTGSQVGPVHPGECLSADYIGKISPVSVRGFNGFYLFKCLFSEYLHVFLTNTKSGEMFALCIEEVVRFYNLHFFTVMRMRFDSGSTELAGSTTDLLKKLGITPDPAAVASQFQNPVEREVQTSVKGVGVMMIDQDTLTDDFWDYGIQSWVATSNATSRNAGPTPDELVLQVVPDLSTHFQFPFGCPVTSTKTEGRQKRFDVTSEFGIAVGSVPLTQSNKTTLVHIPAKSLHGRAFPRLDVRPIKFSVPGIPPADQRDQFLPDVKKTGEIQFKSPLAAAAKPGDVGTLKLGMFQDSPSDDAAHCGEDDSLLIGASKDMTSVVSTAPTSLIAPNEEVISLSSPMQSCKSQEGDLVSMAQPLGSIQHRRSTGEIPAAQEISSDSDAEEPRSTRSGGRYAIRTPKDLLLANEGIAMIM